MVDFDDLFAYETQKIVRIRDRRLGFLFYFLLFLVLCYVVGFQILYSNEHFKRKDVFGTGRITIQQPVKRCNPNKPDCLSDYSPLPSLPYCERFQGESTEVDPEFRRKCVFADQHSLTPFGMLEGNMLVPTRIDSQVEHRGCDIGDDVCDNEYMLDENPEIIYVADIERYTVMFVHTFHRDAIKGNNGQMQGFYYECEVDKTSEAAAAMAVMSATIEGVKECQGTLVRKPIECINDKCPFLQKEKEETKPSAFIEKRSKRFRKKSRDLQAMHKSQGQQSNATLKQTNHSHNMQTLQTSASHVTQDPIIWGQKVPWGTLNTHHGSHHRNHHFSSKTMTHQDQAEIAQIKEPQITKRKPPSKEVFAIKEGDIFSVQKILKLVGLDLDKSFNADGELLRESGTVIEIEAIYNNLEPFLSSIGIMPISYTYKFTQRPMEEMKTEMYAQAQPNFPHERVVENRHGLYLQLKVTGTFGFFSVIYTLVMLTTAVGLVGAAVFITDQVALKWMKHRDKYYDAKYEKTEEFDDSADVLGGLAHG